MSMDSRGATQPAVRDYEPGDAPFIARLFFESVHILGARHYNAEQIHAWAPGPVDPADIHAQATDGRIALVATGDDDRIVGHGDLEPDGHIDHLFVSPDAAGSGVGSLLIAALVARARAAGMRRLYVEASEGAKPMFARAGFTLLRRRDFVLRDVAIHNYAMELALR